MRYLILIFLAACCNDPQPAEPWLPVTVRYPVVYDANNRLVGSASWTFLEDTNGHKWGLDFDTGETVIREASAYYETPDCSGQPFALSHIHPDFPVRFRGGEGFFVRGHYHASALRDLKSVRGDPGVCSSVSLERRALEVNFIALEPPVSPFVGPLRVELE